MAKVIVLGSSSMFPLPRTNSNKFSDYFDIANYQKKFPLHKDSLCAVAQHGGRDKRTRSCLALVAGQETILFDAGPDIAWQLKKYKLKPTAAFISHNHPDANYGIRYLKNIPIFSAAKNNVFPKQAIKFSKQISVWPFRVQHTTETPCLGYFVSVKAGNRVKKFAYFTDCATLAGLKPVITRADLVFVDGSAFKRSFVGHMSLSRQLLVYKKWLVNRVYITHIGHGAPPHAKLVAWAKERYEPTAVAYDGLVIKL